MSVPADDPELAQLLGACWGGDFTLVAQLLIRRPALAKAHGPGGSTPLHVAAQCNDPQLAVIPLAAGADPEAVRRIGPHALSGLTCNSIECGAGGARVQLDFFCNRDGAIEDVRRSSTIPERSAPERRRPGARG